MNYYDVNDELGLRLRHWLIKQTDKGLYGLEWVNNKTGIKLLWVNQHHPNWEMSYELFIAWAKHRGKYKEPPEYTKLKGNFRSAMKRSLDFEEIKSINTLQQGNYKIFKICSKEEVETKRNQERKKKRPIRHIEEKATVYEDSPDNLSPVASIKIMPPHAVLLNEQIPNNITVSTSSNCEKYVPVVDSLLNNSKTPYSLKELRCDDIERFFNGYLYSFLSLTYTQI